MPWLLYGMDLYHKKVKGENSRDKFQSKYSIIALCLFCLKQES